MEQTPVHLPRVPLVSALVSAIRCIRLPARIVVLASTPCLAAVGCSDSRAASGVLERTDSAGVEIVVLDGADRTLEWRFERDFTLGGAEEGPESFYSVHPRTVDVDRQGNLHVLDGAAHRVVVFDPSGRHLRTFGGEGEGPGEMPSPGSLVVEPDGTVAVFDYGKRALVRFAPDGTPRDERPLRLQWLAFHRFFRPLPDGLAVAARDLAFEGEGTRAHLVVIRSADTSEVTAVRMPPAEMVMFPECGYGLRFPPLFQARIAWDSREDRLAVAAWPRYRVDLLRGDSLVRSIRRRVEPRPATRDLALEELGEGLEVSVGSRGPCRADPERMVDGRGFADVVPPVEWVDIAPDGTLWVRRKVVGEDNGPIDLLDPDGGYLGTLPAGTPRPVAFLPDGRIAAAETDEFDVDRLVVYRIVKEPPE